jgi:hypothetical protein
MASDGSVIVRFGGDTTGLDSAVAVAKAQLAGFNAEVRRLAKEVAAAGADVDDKLVASLRDAAATAAAAKAELGSLSRTTRDARGSGAAATNDNEPRRLQSYEWTNLGRQGGDIATMAFMGMSPLQIATSQAAQVFDVFASSSIGAKAALADFGSTILNVVTNPLVAFSAAAVAAAASVGYLAVESHKSAIEIDGLLRAADFSGVANIAKSNIDEIRASIRSIRDTTSIWSGVWNWMAEISAADAKKIENALFTMRNGSSDAIRAIVSDISAYAAATRQDIPAAAEMLTKAFGDPLNQGERLAQLIPSVTKAQRDLYEEAARSGSVTQAQAALQTILTEALDRSTRARKEELEALLRQKQEQANAMGVTAASITGLYAQIGAIMKEIAALERAERAHRDLNSALAGSVPTLQQWGNALRDALEAAGGGKIEQLQQKLERLQGAMRGFQDASGAAEAPAGDWWTSDRRRHAIERLQNEAGLSRWGASGLVARWAGVEAPAGPASVNPKSGAFGIGQWLGERKATIAGDTDFDAQLSYAIRELNGGEAKSGEVLRRATTPAEAARGASMFERAEGYSPATGEDNFTAKTPVRRVYADAFESGRGPELMAEAAEAAAQVKDQVLAARQAKEGGNEIDKANVAVLERQLSGKRDEVAEQKIVVSGIERQRDLTSSTTERTKLQVQLDQARVTLSEKQAAAKRAELQLAVGRAEGGPPERARDARVALAEYDMSRAAEGSAQYNAALGQKEAAQRAFAETQKQLTRAEIDGEIAEAQRGLAAKRRLYDEESGLKRLSEDDKLAAVRAAIEEEYRLERSLLDRQLALEEQKPAQRLAVLNRIKALEARHAEEVAQINGRAAQRAVAPWHQMIDTTSSQMASSITGIITRTESFGDAARNVARSVVSQFVQMGVHVVADWAKNMATRVALTVSSEQVQTAAAATGAAARTGIDAGAAAAGTSMKLATVVKSIQTSAAETYAGVFGWFSPVLGPFAAAPAAAAAALVSGMTALASFDVGSWELDRTQLATVHQGEMIIPAAPAAAIRAALPATGWGGLVSAIAAPAPASAPAAGVVSRLAAPIRAAAGALAGSALALSAPAATAASSIAPAEIARTPVDGAPARSLSLSLPSAPPAARGGLDRLASASRAAGAGLSGAVPALPGQQAIAPALGSAASPASPPLALRPELSGAAAAAASGLSAFRLDAERLALPAAPTGPAEPRGVGALSGRPAGGAAATSREVAFTMPVNNQFRVQSLDARSLKRFLQRNGRELAKSMSRSAQLGAHLGLAGLTPK